MISEYRFPPLKSVESWIIFPPALLLVVLLVLMVFSEAAAAAGNTYYVSTGGSDQNPGTLAEPWRTVQHAADSAGPGDTVYVKGGTYYEAVILNTSGATGSPLTFAAYPGETPVLNGSGAEWAAFQLAPGVSHVNIEGFTIEDYHGVGLDISGANSYITLSSLDISSAEVGMRMTWGYSGDQPMFGVVDHVAVTGSSFHDNHFAGIDCTPGPCDDISLGNVDIKDNGVGAESFGADGLAVEKGARITVDQVRVINNGGDGIDLNSRDGGPVEGILVSRSIVGSNRRNGIKLWAGGRIENSLIYGTALNPLPLADFSGVAVELVNNTIAYNMWDESYSARDYAMTVGYSDGAPTTGISLTMVNNIFAFNTGPAVGSPTGIYLGPGVTLTSESNNLYFSRDDCEIQADFTAEECFTRSDITGTAWMAATGQGGADLTSDPLFTDPAGFDFHLELSSPAVNTGTANSAPLVDLDGRSRPRGSGYDIGAYEGSGVAQPSLAISLDDSFWAGYADYIERELSVRYRVQNSGGGAAHNVTVLAIEASGQVQLLSSLPFILADMPPGTNQNMVLKYRVPPGVTVFRSITRLRCEDSEGEVINYPAP